MFPPECRPRKEEGVTGQEQEALDTKDLEALMAQAHEALTQPLKERVAEFKDLVKFCMAQIPTLSETIEAQSVILKIFEVCAKVVTGERKEL